MSYRITEDAIRVDAVGVFLSAPVKAVLVALASHANNDGTEARPSVDTLARETGFHPRTVKNTLHKLVHLRLIEITQRAGQHRPTVYRINLVRLQALPRVGQGCTSAISDQECTSATPAHVTNPIVAPEVHVSTSQRCTSVPVRGGPGSPESVLESVSESKARRPLVAVRAQD